jgi:hypothetical protein
VATGTERWTLSFIGIPEPAFIDPAHCLIFSADGRMLLTGHWGCIRFWELAAKEERWTLKHGARALALTPDQGLLASGDDTSAILLWDMRRLGLVGGPEKLTPAQLHALWADLAGKARPAFVALARLAAAPDQAVPFVAERLRQGPVDPRRLRALIAGLGSSKFSDREKATSELRRLGAVAEQRLRQALQDNPTAETRRRVQELLKDLEGSLREARAVELLERIGSAEARGLLATLAAESPSPRLRQQAYQALARLHRGRAGIEPAKGTR